MCSTYEKLNPWSRSNMMETLGIFFCLDDGEYILSPKSSPLLSQPEHLELDGTANPNPGAEGGDEVEHVRVSIKAMCASPGQILDTHAKRDYQHTHRPRHAHRLAETRSCRTLLVSPTALHPRRW